MKNYVYAAIDLKSFYASVECVERGLNSMTTNLAVADKSRTDKTICLAVSPSLKAYGIPGRARLFEVVQKVREVNEERKRLAPGQRFTGASCDDTELKQSPQLAVDYLVAPPRMALYMDYSARIYNIYLKYIAPEDIHVYSIDEVFIDLTQYLDTYQLTARELTEKMIHDILDTTGITATAGIGTNLFLCKVAMDVMAKRTKPDQYGVIIAELDERSYRRQLWAHRPVTDIWRVGRGYARKLEEQGLYTMGDVARCSLGKATDYYNEELLYQLFGVNAELLIDHAWGWEPCTMADIKAYKPDNNSIGSGQVLQCPYDCEHARLIVQEMADQLVLELVDKGLVTDQLVLTVGYDRENITPSKHGRVYKGEVTVDRYGRRVPKHAHGTVNLESYTSSLRMILDAVLGLYDEIINHELLVRRVYLTASHVINEKDAPRGGDRYEQLELFTDYEKLRAERELEEQELQKEKKLQEAVLSIKKKFGKNAVLKGINLKEGATAIERNGQIGGHKA